ncbi:MAG: hypothetical protein AAF901_12865 [Bacteroidota bacterium]
MPQSSQDESEPEKTFSFEGLIPLSMAAEISGLSASHLSYLARKKEIWAMKMGRDWLTTEPVIREYMARDRRPGPKPKQKSR